MAGPHLVVVDDDDSILTLLGASLRAGLGARVTCFSSAEAALAAWPTLEAPDLLLTDYSMPGMNGLALAAALRRASPTLPVVVLSAVEVPLEASELVARFLTKPCPPRVLLPVLRELLSLPAPPAQASRPAGSSARRAELAARYVLHLATVRSRLGGLVAQAGTPEGERALRDELHQLAGTAGSYGFTEVTQAAQALRAAIIARAPLDGASLALDNALRATQRS